MSDRQYWAHVSTQAKKSCGPFPTRQAAIEAVRAKYPATTAAAKRGDITSGYGAFGPHFDIQWNARDAARDIRAAV